MLNCVSLQIIDIPAFDCFLQSLYLSWSSWSHCRMHVLPTQSSNFAHTVHNSPPSSPVVRLSNLRPIWVSQNSHLFLPLVTTHQNRHAVVSLSVHCHTPSTEKWWSWSPSRQRRRRRFSNKGVCSPAWRTALENQDTLYVQHRRLWDMFLSLLEKNKLPVGLIPLVVNFHTTF